MIKQNTSEFDNIFFAKNEWCNEFFQLSDHLFCFIKIDEQKVYTNKIWSNFFGPYFLNHDSIRIEYLIKEGDSKTLLNICQSLLGENTNFKKVSLTCIDEFQKEFKTIWKIKYDKDKNIYVASVSFPGQTFSEEEYKDQTSKLELVKESNERFNVVVSNIPIMLSLFDENGNFEWINKAWVDELGWDMVSMQDRDMMSEFYPDPKVKKEVLDFMISGLYGWKDFYLRKRDGSYIHTSWTNIRLSNGKTVGLGQNITDQIRVKEQLVHTSKMISLGEIASGVAHEINNPLTIIYGKVNYILNLIERGQLNEEILKTELNKINHNSERIANIVQSLRSFSRDSENEAILPVDLHSAVNDALNLCNQLFKNREIALDLKIQEQLLVECRSSELSQVLLNLLTNSYESIEKSEDKWISIEAGQNEKHIWISVKDSGRKIDEKTCDKIFEPFFTTKNVGEGVGLGLSIGQSIIEKYHGRLYLKKNSEYTEFIIELPLYIKRS